MSDAPTPIEEAKHEHSSNGSAESNSYDSNSSATGTPESAPLVEGTTDTSQPVENSPVEAVVPPAGTVDISETDTPPTNSGYVHSETETLHDVATRDRETLGFLGEPKDEDVAFTYPTHLDPNRQVDPHGVYLDDLERRNAELVRARIENREPDLENPPAVCSTPLLPTVAAANQALPGVLVPVDSVESVNVGVNPEDVTGNSAAAEAQGLNPDGSERNTTTE